MRSFYSWFLTLLFFVLTSSASAQIPRTLSYQGVLTDSAGVPKADGTYSVTFRLYTASSGGGALWTEVKSLSVKRGVFNTILGDVTPLNVSFDSQYWLGIQVASDPELSPRVRFTSVGYSIRSIRADSASYAPGGELGGVAGGDLTGTYPNPSIAANAVTGTKILDGTITGSDIAKPTTLTATNTSVTLAGSNAGLVGSINSTPGFGVLGSASATTGETYGVYGTSNSESGYGVRGYASNASGTSYGMHGASNSPSGRGVHGEAPTYGMYGLASAGTGTTYGVYGESNSTGGFGLYGKTTAETGVNYGVFGANYSATGRAVGGRAYASSGVNYGVYGASNSTDGYGVYGSADAASGTTYGIYGRSLSTSGRGVVGYASAASGTTYGVYGSTVSPDGFSGYFTGRGYFGGNVGVGTTTPSARIDISNSSSTAGFRVIQTGTGRGGTFQVMNASTSNSALYVTTVSNNAPALTVVSTGSAPAMSLAGRAQVDVLEITGADLAEQFPFSEPVEPGMVVAIDADHPGQLCLSRGVYNKRVAGIVAGANDFSTGVVLGHASGNDMGARVALTGRVYVWCNATQQSIEPGDMLTTSDRPGYAMAVTDHNRAHGAIIGKAMTRLEQGQTGLVLVLVTLQ